MKSGDGHMLKMIKLNLKKKKEKNKNRDDQDTIEGVSDLG